MGKKLTPDQNELYIRVDEVLHYLWDPIGISEFPEARDEYWSYLPVVFGMLIQDFSKSNISDYLISIESDRMGVPVKAERTEKAVDALIRWKKKIIK